MTGDDEARQGKVRQGKVRQGEARLISTSVVQKLRMT